MQRLIEAQATISKARETTNRDLEDINKGLEDIDKGLEATCKNLELINVGGIQELGKYLLVIFSKDNFRRQ